MDIIVEIIKVLFTVAIIVFVFIVGIMGTNNRDRYEKNDNNIDTDKL